jgi:hypothetical protein
MKKKSYYDYLVFLFSVLSISLIFSDCKKSENPIKFPKGIFPDSIYNLSAINSAYDDYNVALYQLSVTSPIIFSSNRKSLGGQFDLEQASVSFNFDQTNGNFSINAEMSNDPFLNKLINKAITPGNDFGPYRLFSPADGFEYLLLSSANEAGNLDLFYLRNQPVTLATLPDVEGPLPIKLLNTSFDDAYLSFNSNFDSAYFTSSRDGNFDIYLHMRPAEKNLSTWFNLDYATSSKVDSVNSTSDDKCPFVYKNILVFASDRPGGYGGLDLYYSIFRKGNWSSPVNFGPKINSSSDEYRPVIANPSDFKNYYMMFSSNRPGGKGGFDLYFTGFTFPK